ncbi:MAG: ferric reductase-like transmembrane domain-containing protein [Gemmatimonadota bacterium]|nr:ferric reductase-like transmembrane domain-containing protein [Gemmatimonadota bacterium]
MLTERFKRRALRHHLPIGAAAALGMVLMLPLVHSDRGVQRWSLATAYVALALLAATLVTGPYWVLKGRRHPTSSDLRRDLGIWAGGFGLAHVVFGLQVHLKYRYLYWFRELNGSRFLRPRTDAFGLTNDLGVVAVVVVVVLLAISNDMSLRRLGAARWKKIQQWNYWYLGLVVVHAAIYELLEKRIIGLVILGLVIATGVVAIQLAGLGARKGDP